jgi:DNA-binding transcriptional LysR family regulator
MDFGELRYFAHMARAGSFSGAAKHLNIVGSAVSRQLKKLGRAAIQC